MKSPKQNGFSVAEALLLIVIAGIIGGTGYYVWHAREQTDKTLNSAVNTAQTVPKTTSIKTFADCQKSAGSIMQETYPEVCVTKSGQRFTQPASATTQQYLTIKEWGVKMQTGKDSQDAYYVYESGASSGLYLDSHDLDLLTANDGSSCKGEYIAIMGRYSKDDPNLNDPTYLGPILTKKTIGDYLYTFATKKEYAAPCLYDANNQYAPIEANLAVYNTKTAAYTTMFDTLQAE